MLTIKLTELLEKQYELPIEILSMKVAANGAAGVTLQLEVEIGGEPASRVYVEITA